MAVNWPLGSFMAKHLGAALISFVATLVSALGGVSLMPMQSLLGTALILLPLALLAGSLLGVLLGRHSIAAIAFGAVGIPLVLGIMMAFMVDPLAIVILPGIALYGACVSAGAASVAMAMARRVRVR